MAMNPRSGLLIRSRLNMRQIALLAHLDDERCVQRAAAAVGMTQPAASRSLREIEDALQVQLFERHARGIVTTSSGEILVRHARSILSEINLAQEELATLKSGLSGQASVGTITAPAAALQFEPLGDERHAVIVGGQHSLAGGDPVQLEDLVHFPWILPPPGSVLGERIMGLFVQRRLPVPPNVIQSQSLPVITNILRATDAVAVVQREAVQPLCDSRFLSILIEDLGLEVGCYGIITRRGHKLSPGAQALLESLRATGKDFASGGI